MQEPKSYGKVKLSTVKAAIAQIEEHYKDCPEKLEEVYITFECLYFRLSWGRNCLLNTQR